MSSEEVALAESRIKKLHRDMRITSADRSSYLQLAKWIGGNARVELKRMASKGIVVADSNGSNSITWSLAP